MGLNVRQLFLSLIFLSGACIFSADKPPSPKPESLKSVGVVDDSDDVSTPHCMMRVPSGASLDSLPARPEEIEYARATVADIDSINTIFETMNEEDAACLVRLPLPVIADNVTKGRFFVARFGDTIVSICKLYVVPEDEIGFLLGDELAALSSPPKNAFYYSLSSAAFCNYSVPLVSFWLAAPYAPCCDSGVAQYIYYGSAYTRPVYRATPFHINSRLEMFALETLKREGQISWVSGRKLLYCYGVVGSKLRIDPRLRSFAMFTSTFINESARPDVFNFSVYTFVAKKPVFETSEESTTGYCPSPFGSPLRAGSSDGSGYLIEFTIP